MRNTEKTRTYWLFMALLLLTLLLWSFGTAVGENGQTFTDVAVLSTTDMHGRCWHTNVLTDGTVYDSMLRVSTAVRQIREKYGAENVILVDNGDLFQGTPVSQVQLMDFTAGEIPGAAGHGAVPEGNRL